MAQGPRLLVGAVLLVSGLSGCADTPATTFAVPSESPKVPADELISEHEGAIRGLVLDDGLVPVANATIILGNGTKDGGELARAVTELDGRFVFGPLAPQTYRVSAQATGYALASQLVQVVALEVTRVNLTLGQVATKTPYMEVFINPGVTGCSPTAVWLVLGMPCDVVVTSYKDTFKAVMPATWEYAVFEIAWETNDAIWMYAQLHDGSCINPGDPCPGEAKGVGYARFDGAPNSEYNTTRHQWGEMVWPDRGKDFEYWLQVSDFGLLYNEINSYGRPICDLNGYCGGVGMAIEIRFTEYTSVFHYAPPPVAEKYSAVPDA